MAKFLALAFILFTRSLIAKVGDVKEVNHENLISFSNVQDSSCRFQLERPNAKYQQVTYTIWLYIEYQDTSGGGTSRKILQPLVGDDLCSKYGDGCDYYCNHARQKAFDALASWNLFLNDLKKNNLMVDSDHVCLARYFVATLREEIATSTGGKADYADIKWSTKAAKCP